MPRIEVDYGALVRHGETLRAVAEDLDLAHHRVESLRSRALGSRSVDGALNHFAGRWDYGMGVLVSEVEEAGCALLAVGATYERLEGTLASGFAQVALQEGTPAPAPEPRFPPRAYGPDLPPPAGDEHLPFDDWTFPGLGFNPLPADPDVSVELARDCRTFAQRMVDEAMFLQGAGSVGGWTGPAATEFAAGLGELPVRLDECGEAFARLALYLEAFYERLVEAKAEAVRLESEGRAARAALEAARCAPPPVLLPADVPVITTSSLAALQDAEEELHRIVESARGLRGRFDQSVGDIAAAIRALTDWAPERPRRSWLDRVGEVANDLLNPVEIVGNALAEADALLDEIGWFLDDLADLTSSLSGTLGFLSVAFIWAPGIGQTFAIAALATAATTAVVRTGLYAAEAEDEYGRRYVSTGELVGSYVDVAAEGAGVGLGALAKNATSGAGLVDDLARETSIIQQAGHAIGDARKLRAGQWDAARDLAVGTWRGWKEGGFEVMAPNVGAFFVDVFAPTVAPLATGGEFDRWNIAGIKEVGRLPMDVHDLLVNGPEPEPAGPEPADRPSRMREAPPTPVMED